MRDVGAIEADATDGSPFSNSTEGEGWMGSGHGCYSCVNDDEAAQRYCPLLSLALTGRTPAEWERTGLSDYRCSEFEARS